MELKDSSSNPENMLSLLLELEIFKAILVQEITARGEVEELLKKMDMKVSDLTERCQQYQASESSLKQQIQIYEQTTSDFEATVFSLENKVNFTISVLLVLINHPLLFLDNDFCNCWSLFPKLDILTKEAGLQRVQREEQDELQNRTRSSMEKTTKVFVCFKPSFINNS